ATFSQLAGKRKLPLTIITVALKKSAGRAALYRVRGSPVGIESIFQVGTGRAMADDEKEGAAEAAAPAPKGKLKLIIAVVAVLAVAGGGATWFFFMRHHGEEGHAEAAAPPPKPPSYVAVPDMLVNLLGLPGERVQYLKVKIVLEVKEEKQVEAIKPSLP